jgi:dihydrofolate reductase
MSKLRIHIFSISLDGYGAGPDQGVKEPLGRNGESLHDWVVPTRSFKGPHAKSAGRIGVDDAIAAQANENIGAWILGRNMFGPVRGPWPDESWKGWWGNNPPYHCPVFVLTHHARRPIEMQGGTTFYFVTEGIRAALEQATKAAQGKDVRLGGGAATIRQYFQERLVDEMHLAVSPIFLGGGEHLFYGSATSASTTRPRARRRITSSHDATGVLRGLSKKALARFTLLSRDTSLVEVGHRDLPAGVVTDAGGTHRNVNPRQTQAVIRRPVSAASSGSCQDLEQRFASWDQTLDYVACSGRGSASTRAVAPSLSATNAAGIGCRTAGLSASGG